MKSTGLFPLAAYALFPAYGYAGRGGRREERGKKRGGGRQVESFLFSKYRTQSDTLGCRANINALLHLVYIIMGV